MFPGSAPAAGVGWAGRIALERAAPAECRARTLQDICIVQGRQGQAYLDSASAISWLRFVRKSVPFTGTGVP
jgi:hypothetical protein